MSKLHPQRIWGQKRPSEEQILGKERDAKWGWILEVDLEYPEELHEEHNSYPIAPKKKASRLVTITKRAEEVKKLSVRGADLLLTLQDKNQGRTKSNTCV